MKRFSGLFLSLIFIGLCCTSCSDDPALAEMRERQKTEILRLKGELELIEEKLKMLPPDVSKELAEVQQLSEKQTAEIASLENEIASLSEKKRTMRNEFDAYRAKYQIK
jgi:chromosome segregation ATPase